MAYDEKLAERVTELIAALVEPTALKMFGGLAFMVNTHMACGVLKDDLMVRVGKDDYDAALARGAREMDFTGRPMRGLVIVDATAIKEDAQLEQWINQAVAFAESQPPKPRKPPKQRD